jgi:hypothetical protein
MDAFLSVVRQRICVAGPLPAAFSPCYMCFVAQTRNRYSFWFYFIPAMAAEGLGVT